MIATSIRSVITRTACKRRRTRYAVTASPWSALPDLPEVPPAALQRMEVLHLGSEPRARRHEEHRDPRRVLQGQALDLAEDLLPLRLVRRGVRGKRQRPGLLARVVRPEAVLDAARLEPGECELVRHEHVARDARQRVGCLV